MRSVPSANSRHGTLGRLESGSLYCSFKAPNLTESIEIAVRMKEMHTVVRERHLAMSQSRLEVGVLVVVVFE